MTGPFDLNLTWTPDPGLQPVVAPGQPAGDAPSIFTAVEEQLGLRLVAGRAPTAVLVIDRLEPPTPD